MRSVRIFLSRLYGLVRATKLDRERQIEMAAHLDEAAEDYVQQGFSEADARREAARRFGRVAHAEDACRDARSFITVDQLARDVRESLRSIRRNASFSILVVLVLGIGIGAVTSVFALLNRIVLQPLAFPESHQLVVIRHSAPGMNLPDVGMSSGLYYHYAQHVTSLASLAVYSERVLNLRIPESDGGTERVRVAYAGSSLFKVLRTSPALGRLFTEEDALPGFMNMRWTIPVLLSHGFWVSHYGRDPQVIGRILLLNDSPRKVVGVLPDGFAFPDAHTQIVMLMEPPRATASFAQDFGWNAVARLQPGAPAAAAQVGIARALAQIEGSYKDATPTRIAEVGLRPFVRPLKDAAIGDIAGVLWTVLAAMGIMLCIAGFNAAALFASRAEGRRGEVAIRQALGARRHHVARLFVVEALLLSCSAALVGLGIAKGLLTAIIAVAPVELPRAQEVKLDSYAFALAAALAFVMASGYGALSIRGQRQSVTSRLVSHGDRRVTSGRARRCGGDAFIVPQVALALTLMAGSALMAKTYRNLSQIELGFSPERLLAVELGLPGRKANQHVQIYRDAVQRIGGLPGVERASVTSFAPLTPIEHIFPVERGGTPVAFKFFLPGYFQTLSVPIVEGGSFADGEHVAASSPVMISASLARRLFPGDTAIGRSIRRLNEDGTVAELKGVPLPAFTIVGVVGDVRETTLRHDSPDVVYIPMVDEAVERSIIPTNVTLVVRTQVPPLTLGAAVRKAIAAADPALSVGQIRTMDSIVQAARARETFVGSLLLLAAAISLFMGVVGIYGSVTHLVARRTREIGIRIALGAQRSQLIVMTTLGSIRAVLVGTVLGLAVTLLVSGLLGSLLFGVAPRDPMILSTVAGAVIAVAVGSALLASRRAIGPDPLIAIRAD